jgi:hypothetical protein
MTASLTPTLAIEFVTALSADIRAAAVLDATGEPLAGPPELAAAVRPLARARDTATTPSWTELEGEDGRGKVFAARDERHLIVVVTGPLALGRVTRHDLRTALAALGGQIVPIGPPGRLDEGLTRTLLDLAVDDFRRARAKKTSDLEP